MNLSSKEKIHKILLDNETDNIFSIWEFINGLDETCYKIIWQEADPIKNEIRYLIKYPIKDNPICLYRNKGLTHKGREWIGKI